MDPTTAMIVSAVTAGAVAGTTAVAPQLVKDAYAGLKALIVRKLGQKADVEDALAQLEKNPDSQNRRGLVEEELEAADAADDAEIVAQAKALLDLLVESGQMDAATYNVIVSGSGAAAIGPGAVAAGKGGIAVGGNVEGGIRLGGSTDDDEEAPQ